MRLTIHACIGDAGEDPLEVSGGDRTKLLAADYLGLGRDEWEIVDHFAAPMLHDNSELGTKESELYFYPSNSAGQLIYVEPCYGASRTMISVLRIRNYIF